MSIVTLISQNQALIVQYLSDYEDYLATIEPFFEMDGKRLEQICKEHSQKLYMFKKKLNDLKSLEEFFKMKMDEKSSERFKHWNEKHQRALSTKDIQQYILSDPDYLTAAEIYLEVVHMKNQYVAVVEGLEDMGWMISHITKLRVAELEDALLS